MSDKPTTQEVHRAVELLITHVRYRCAEAGRELRFPDISRWKLGVETFCGQVKVTVTLDGAELVP